MAGWRELGRRAALDLTHRRGRLSLTMDKSIELLMCAPDHFGIRYVINPWMEGNINRAVAETAVTQWRNLHDVLAQHAKLHLVRPQSGLPDMVFTANAGLVVGRRVVLSRFLHRERQGEEHYFKR